MKNLSLSEITRQVRKSMKISQKELARMIGTNQTEVSFIERGFIPSDEQKIVLIKQIYEHAT